MEEKKDDISALTSAIEDKLRVFEETIDGKLASHTAQILELVQDRRIRRNTGSFCQSAYDWTPLWPILLNLRGPLGEPCRMADYTNHNAHTWRF